MIARESVGSVRLNSDRYSRSLLSNSGSGGRSSSISVGVWRVGPGLSLRVGAPSPPPTSDGGYGYKMTVSTIFTHNQQYFSFQYFSKRSDFNNWLFNHDCKWNCEWTSSRRPSSFEFSILSFNGQWYGWIHHIHYIMHHFKDCMSFCSSVEYPVHLW